MSVAELDARRSFRPPLDLSPATDRIPTSDPNCNPGDLDQRGSDRAHSMLNVLSAMFSAAFDAR